MKYRIISSICVASFLAFVVLISCSSTKNRTEERAKERVIQFIRLMSEDQLDQAEKLLSRQLLQSENKELFINNYDNWQIKDPSIIIEVEDVSFSPKNKNRVEVFLRVRNEKLDFTKMGTMPMKFERGDWYIGG